MATERHEIRCDVCETWYPMRGRYDCEYPPAGWLTLEFQPGHVNVAFPELGLCSVACLSSMLVKRWVEVESQKNREDSDD